jgi:hypothetical protein
MEFTTYCFDNATKDCLFGDFKDMVVDASNIFSLVMDFKPSRTLNVLLMGKDQRMDTFLKKVGSSEDGIVSLDTTEIHFIRFGVCGVADAIVCLYDTHYDLWDFKYLKPSFLSHVNTYFIGSEKNLNKNIFRNHTSHIPNKVSITVSLKTKQGLDELLHKL